MNATDIFILEKVFPSTLKELMMLLSTKVNTRLKIENYLIKSKSKVLQEHNKLPIDMDRFLELLQLKIILPDITKQCFISRPVFISLSRRFQHNILLFINRHPLTKEQLFKWNCFLHSNVNELDSWGRMLKDVKCSKYTSKLSKKSQERISSLRRSSIIFQENQSATLEKQCVNEIVDCGNKTMDLIEINSDSEDFIALCQVGQEEKEETNKNESLIADHEETKMKSLRTGNLAKCDITANIFCKNLESLLSSLTMELHGACNKESVIKVLDLFTECPSNEVKLLCETLELKDITEDNLNTLLSHMQHMEVLSFQYVHSILYHVLTMRILLLKEPISRNLLSILTDFMIENKRLIVTVVLTKIFLQSDFSGIQEDIIKKLILNDSLKVSDITLLLDSIFMQNNDDISISESHVSMLECVLQKNPSISTNCLFNLIKAISKYSVELRKSLKLMKLLIILLQNYSQVLATEKKLLERIVDQNSTFLKKKVLNYLKKL